MRCIITFCLVSHCIFIIVLLDVYKRQVPISGGSCSSLQHLTPSFIHRSLPAHIYHSTNPLSLSLLLLHHHPLEQLLCFSIFQFPSKSVLIHLTGLSVCLYAVSYTHLDVYKRQEYQLTNYYVVSIYHYRAVVKLIN